jgi:hypothetical protein
MVAAQPNFFDVMEGKGKAHHSLEGANGYQFREYRPEKAIVEEYCTGIGASTELATQFYEKPLPVIKNLEDGVEAVIGATHMQFLISRQVARQLAPLPATRALLRTETMSLDHRIDEMGYLHLSTLKPYVFHMGNTLSDRLLEEVQMLDESSIPAIPKAGASRSPQYNNLLKRGLARMARHPRLNPYFVRLYNFLFKALHEV